MFCVKCREIKSTRYQKLNICSLDINEDIFRIDCKVCKNFIAVTKSSEIINIDEKFDDVCQNGWKKVAKLFCVQSERDKIIYYILNQIIYLEIDSPKVEKFESIYAHADDVDEVFIRWIDGKPVGFYTMKLKGTEISETAEKYSMNTLDTAYIRSQYRNRGLGTEILYNIVKHYPHQDIGFSKPISQGMLQVLKKFLTAQKEYRLRFWEIEDGGVEGSIKLIWFVLHRKQII